MGPKGDPGCEGPIGAILMSTNQDGLPEIPALVGFTTCGQGHSPLAATIDVENLTQYVSTYYFTVPSAVEINSLVAFFFTQPSHVPSSSVITIRAQLYEAGEMTNIYSPIEETLVTLTPSINDATPNGTMLRGEVRTNRPAEKNTKLMLVFSATSSGTDPVEAVLGYAKASLSYT
ncbi:MAG: hypothetical protein K2P48_00565 [Lachnospiraceae bacterium]|nr:hypothetical protein [Lachnospiraceae bacterium]